MFIFLLLVSLCLIGVVCFLMRRCVPSFLIYPDPDEESFETDNINPDADDDEHC